MLISILFGWACPAAASTHIYFVTTERHAWATSLAVCQANGGSLAKIGTAGESELARQAIAQNPNFDPWEGLWIGLYREREESNIFRWLSDSSLFIEGTGWFDPTARPYTNWHQYEPNNVCGTENCVAADRSGWYVVRATLL